MNIQMYDLVGDFGEDKDAAARLRDQEIKRALDDGEKVQLDFAGVTLVTQSFVHALISEILRSNGEDILDFIEFKNCTGLVRGIVSTVVQYSLDTLTEDSQIQAELQRDEIEKKKLYEQGDLFN